MIKWEAIAAKEQFDLPSINIALFDDGQKVRRFWARPIPAWGVQACFYSMCTAACMLSRYEREGEQQCLYCDPGSSFII